MYRTFNQKSVDNILKKYLDNKNNLLQEFELLVNSDEAIDDLKFFNSPNANEINKLKRMISEWKKDIDNKWFFIRVNTPATIPIDTNSNDDVLSFTIDVIHGFVLLPDSLEYIVNYKIFDKNNSKVYEKEIRQFSNTFTITLPNVHTILGGRIELYCKVYNKLDDIYSPEIIRVVDIVSKQIYQNDTLTINLLEWDPDNLFRSPVLFEITGYQEMNPELTLKDVLTSLNHVYYDWKIVEKSINRIVVEIVFKEIGYSYTEIPFIFLLSDTSGYTYITYTLMDIVNIFKPIEYTGTSIVSSPSSFIVQTDDESMIISFDKTISIPNSSLIFDGYNTQVYISSNTNEIIFIVDNVIKEYIIDKAFKRELNNKIHAFYKNGLYLVYKQTSYSFIVINESGRYREVILPVSNDLQLVNVSYDSKNIYVSYIDGGYPYLLTLSISTFEVIDIIKGEYGCIIDSNKKYMFTNDSIYILDTSDKTFKLFSSLPHTFQNPPIYVTESVLFGEAPLGYMFYSLQDPSKYILTDNFIDDILWITNNQTEEFLIRHGNYVYKITIPKTYRGEISLSPVITLKITS